MERLVMIDKSVLCQLIVDNLSADLRVTMQAAQTAHAAAINAETQPDNKYDTLSLESSYIAQGYANRGQQIRKNLLAYKNLIMRLFDAETPISIAALVEVEFVSGDKRIIFIAPAGGGMKLECAGFIVNVVTPESPLAQALLGHKVGDMFSWGGGDGQQGEIISLR